MTLQEQIAELPDDCEMFRQVTELDPLAVVPVGFTSQELKALINELTEKVEGYERMMEDATRIEYEDHKYLITRSKPDMWVGTPDRIGGEMVIKPTPLEVFESLSK